MSIAATPSSTAAAEPAAGADLAALAAKAFAPAVAAQAAAAITPTPAPAAAVVAPAPAAPAAVAPAGAAPKLPDTLLSENPVAATPAKETAEAVAAEAAKPAAPPAYKLAKPESGRLTDAHVEQVEAFAKTHGLTEAQAKQVLARDDLNVAHAFDSNRDELLRDPTLGGVHIDQTIATTKRVLGAIFSPEERKLISSLPIANHRLLHQLCAKVAAFMPAEDASLSPTPGQAARPIPVGQAMYPHLYQK